MNNVHTLKEVAGILKTSVKTAQKLIDDGKLKAFKLGNQWRITSSCIEEYLESMLVPTKKTLKRAKRIQLPTSAVEPKPSQELGIPLFEGVAEEVEIKGEDAEEVKPVVRKIIKGNGIAFQRIPEVDKLILNLKQEGYSYVRIATTLNDKGYTNTNGNEWNKNAVDRRYVKLKELEEIDNA